MLSLAATVASIGSDSLPIVTLMLETSTSISGPSPPPNIIAKRAPGSSSALSTMISPLASTTTPSPACSVSREPPIIGISTSAMTRTVTIEGETFSISCGIEAAP